jgi:hypothetical protein
MGPPEFPQKGPTILCSRQKNKKNLWAVRILLEDKKEKEKTKKEREREYLVPTYLAGNNK